MKIKKLREKALGAIFDNLEVIQEHPQYEAIVRFSFPDLDFFCDYEEAIDELVDAELLDYVDNLDNPRINDDNHDSVVEYCRHAIAEKIQVSDFDINGNYLIWVD